jgi:hypothetical protein
MVEESGEVNREDGVVREGNREHGEDGCKRKESALAPGESRRYSRASSPEVPIAGRYGLRTCLVLTGFGVVDIINEIGRGFQQGF